MDCLNRLMQICTPSELGLLQCLANLIPSIVQGKPIAEMLNYLQNEDFVNCLKLFVIKLHVALNIELKELSRDDDLFLPQFCQMFHVEVCLYLILSETEYERTEVFCRMGGVTVNLLQKEGPNGVITALLYHAEMVKASLNEPTNLTSYPFRARPCESSRRVLRCKVSENSLPRFSSLRPSSSFMTMPSPHQAYPPSPCNIFITMPSNTAHYSNLAVSGNPSSGENYSSMGNPYNKVSPPDLGGFNSNDAANSNSIQVPQKYATISASSPVLPPSSGSSRQHHQPIPQPKQSGLGPQRPPALQIPLDEPSPSPQDSQYYPQFGGSSSSPIHLQQQAMQASGLPNPQYMQRTQSVSSFSPGVPPSLSQYGVSFMEPPSLPSLSMPAPQSLSRSTLPSSMPSFIPPPPQFASPYGTSIPQPPPSSYPYVSLPSFGDSSVMPPSALFSFGDSASAASKPKPPQSQPLPASVSSQRPPPNLLQAPKPRSSQIPDKKPPSYQVPQYSWSNLEIEYDLSRRERNDPSYSGHSKRQRSHSNTHKSRRSFKASKVYCHRCTYNIDRDLIYSYVKCECDVCNRCMVVHGLTFRRYPSCPVCTRKLSESEIEILIVLSDSVKERSYHH